MKKYITIGLLFFLLSNLLLQAQIVNEFPKLLISPNDGYVFFNSNETVEFSWNKYSDTHTYLFELSTDTTFSNIISSIFLDTCSITQNLSVGDYFWRISILDQENDTLFTSLQTTFKIFDLESLNLSFWYDCNNELLVSNDTIYHFIDPATNDTIKQLNATQRPLFVDSISDLNYKSVSRFDGNNDCFFYDTDSLVSMVFALSNSLDPDVFSGYRGLLNRSYSSNPTYLLFAQAGSSNLYTAGGNYFGNNLFINGQADINYTPFSDYKIVSGFKSSPTSFSTLQIGGSQNMAGRYWYGDIAEIIAFSKEYSADTVSLIYDYFQYKYNPPINLGENILILDNFTDTVLNGYKPWFKEYQWSSGSSDSVIVVSETDIYALTVTDLFGNQSSDSIYVQYPKINYPFTDTTICYGDTVIWNPNLPINISRLWSDGTTDTVLKISQAGEYSVELIDMYFNTIYSDTINVSVDSFPTINLLPEISDVCLGSVLFLDTLPENTTTILWSTGSTYDYCSVESTGVYSVSTFNDLGCENTDTTTVNIIGSAPNVAFTFDTVCLGLNTQFLDATESIDPITDYYWEFGGLNTSTLQNPLFLFDSTDTIEVCLTVNTSNCFSISCKDAFVKSVPNADFSIVFGETQCIDNLISFANESDTNSVYNSYNWFFANGLSTDLVNPTSTYNEPGFYDVKLIAESDNGCKDSISKTLTVVDDLPPLAPVDLVSPSDEFIYFGSSSEINFTWNENVNALNYQLELSDVPTFVNILFDTIVTSNSIFISPFSNYDTLYWRVSTIDLCGAFQHSSINTIISNTLDTTFISFWFDANYNIDTLNPTVNYFIEKKNNDTIYQTNLNQQASFISSASLNNKRALVFDGIDDCYISLCEIEIGSALAYANANGTTFSNYKGLINNSQDISPPYIFIGQAGSALLYNSGGSLFGNNIFICNSGTTSFVPLVQYKPIYGYTNNPSSFSSIQLGGSQNNSSRFWDGNISEVILFDTALNESVLNDYYQYLRHKYSPPVNLGFDIDVPYGFCDTTITTADKPWFTDYLWSTGDTTPTISTNFNGEYTVTVTDIFGFTSTDDIRVNFPRVTQADAISMVCDGDTLIWDSDLPSDGYTFNWLNSSSTDAFASYWQNQQAALQVTDTNGCSFYTDTVNILLDMFEHTAALGDGDTALCNGNLLSLVNGADEAVDFLWQDGSTTPEILIETAGTYHLTVTNTLGCTARDTIDVSILGTVPVPNFTVTGFCAEENIQLNDISTSSDGTINAWEWSTNGSPFSTDQNTNISFDTLGIYPVQLEVFTDVGCHHTITQDIEIHPLPAPAFSPITACAMQNVQFDNLSTITQGSLSTSQWQFAAGGDWISADMQAVQHNFDSDGLYDVSLSVMSEAGCEQIITQTLEVRPSPVADFSASAGCVGEAVYFWNQTNAAGTQLWDYAWEFGDGNTATASDPFYTYNTTGDYTIELIAKSLNGCTDTIQKTLTVHNLPVAAVSNLYACLGVPHQPEDITGNEAGNIAAWKWEIDTLEFEIENPVVTMTEAGEYALSLWVESETGCTSQIDTMLYVWENPVASFELPQTWGAVPLSLTLENNSEQSETWEWDFGDGETSALETPDHVWQDSGNYTVQLIAISPYGCSDTTALNLRVIIPLVDVAVIAMESKMDGNYLDVTADIINPGTVPISNLGITLDPGNGEIIREVLPEEFAEGAVLRYHFNAQPYFGSGQLPAYVCVSLDPGVPDDQPDNNQLCDMHEAEFTLQAMYPNPVMDMLNLSVLLPQSGDLNVEVYDASGQRVKSLSIDLNSGYHALALDCSDLSSGRYQLRLSFNDQEILKPFVK